MDKSMLASNVDEPEVQAPVYVRRFFSFTTRLDAIIQYSFQVNTVTAARLSDESISRMQITRNSGKHSTHRRKSTDAKCT